MYKIRMSVIAAYRKLKTTCGASGHHGRQAREKKKLDVSFIVSQSTKLSLGRQ